MQLQLQYLLNRLRPAPEHWFAETEKAGKVLEPLPCDSWEELRACWQSAMEWTDFLDITLSSMLAVVTSTPLQGDQLWLRAIGIPGTAKTTLCDAISTNRTYCKPISIMTGLHSGYKDESGKDFSLMDRLNRRTGVVNEGDVLATAGNKDKILAEWRDVYSGFTHADYRNQDAKSYEGLRMTLILAGTPKLRAMNSSALGDRFLDCVIYKRESDIEESKLVRSVLRANRMRRISESNGEAQTYDSPEKILAKQKTAGYVDWLRKNGPAKLQQIVDTMPEPAINRVDIDCEMLGRLVAYMRTRAGVGDEDATEKELHIRLAEQLSKAAWCTAVVMNRTIDGEVMRRTAKLAYDTCFGNTFDIAKLLLGKQMDIPSIAIQIRKTQDAVRKSLGILYQLDAVRVSQPAAESGARNRGRILYGLTGSTSSLLNRLNTLLGSTNA